jgi:hypothetical protein
VRSELKESRVQKPPPPGALPSRRQRKVLAPQAGEALALFCDTHYPVARARLDQATFRAEQDVSWARRLAGGKPQGDGTALGLGNREIGSWVVCPQVPKQERLILHHFYGTERGGFEQRLRGAQRQQIGEIAFVQRIKQGYGLRSEDRIFGLDADAGAALHGPRSPYRRERGGNVGGAVEHPRRAQRSGVRDDLVAAVGQAGDRACPGLQLLDRGRCQGPIEMREDVCGAHQPQGERGYGIWRPVRYPGPPPDPGSKPVVGCLPAAPVAPVDGGAVLWQVRIYHRHSVG